MIATDPLSLFFIGCFLIGLLFLLIIAFAGHAIGHHTGATSHTGPIHVGHTPTAPIASAANTVHGYYGNTGTAHADTGQNASQTSNQGVHGSSFSVLSVLNLLNIVLFLMGFGFFGYVFHVYTASFALPFIFIFAGIGGLAIAAILIIALNRLFGNAVGTAIQDVSDRTGLLGKVNMAIPQKGIGEIIYVSPGGMRKSVPARSVDGRRLEREQEVVVINYRSGVAEVDTWEHFINQEESGTGNTHQNDEMAALKALLDETD
jgi:hypothetical protein